uniref:Rab9 effector protein with kelch motifs n=1 Tax=Tetraselmis sp. GSL018 TaxID=582737 RepID=A0A061R1V9_9CHLO|eukprot:CAMPEP_0177607056 /NCGR_PEP_ID=MMETSP0419_2-20121207/17690_1 /TAXON_ID=582737 /ORGANISM="Tetraselmis sp., Strain GSL018" /LENGTH=581 /DNA_ID=CAMNT_0019101565 /DNA_START=83 /DNA_END=1828 /DNA_ORIENTATION=+
MDNVQTRGMETARAALDENDWFQGLSHELILACLQKMPANQILKMAQLSKFWYSTATEEGLWQFLVQRDWQDSPFVSGSLRDSAEQAGGWRRLYRLWHRRQALKLAAWQRLRPAPSGDAARGPSAREGHTLAPYGGGAVVFGGWCETISNDVFFLRPKAEGGFAWEEVRAEEGAGDEVPRVRYGHSLTRCGPRGELLVAFGGMVSGGYRGVLGDVVVLRPRTPKEGEGEGEPPAGGPPDGARLRFHAPACKGPAPAPRGYHSAAASEDGARLYVFGGITHGSASGQLAVLDVATWTWDLPDTFGEAPCPRFGSAMAVYKGKLWVVGGGIGSDLLRTGGDLDDVHCLDLASMEWTRVAVEGNPGACIGRETGHVLVGSKLLLFGGSLEFHNKVFHLDLETLRWGAPRVIGRRPPGRISGRMALAGNAALMFGGWLPSCGEIGDLHMLRLDVDDSEAEGGSAEADSASIEEHQSHLRSLVHRREMTMQWYAAMMFHGDITNAQEAVAELAEISQEISDTRDKLRDLGASTDDVSSGEEMEGAVGASDSDEDYLDPDDDGPGSDDSSAESPSEQSSEDVVEPAD